MLGTTCVRARHTRNGANLRRQVGPSVAFVVAAVIVFVVWDGLYARGMRRDTGWVYIREMRGSAARRRG